MKKIRFTRNYGVNRAGWVIGTTDSAAADLVAKKFAVYVEQDTRALKYAPLQITQAECVQPEANKKLKTQ